VSLLLDGLVLKARVPIHGVSASQVCQNMPMISNAVPKSGVARPLSYTHSHTLHACVVHMYPASRAVLSRAVVGMGKGGVFRLYHLPPKPSLASGIFNAGSHASAHCQRPSLQTSVRHRARHPLNVWRRKSATL